MKISDLQVLVVDDNEVQRLKTVCVLAEMGIAALDECADGHEALQHLSAALRAPDIVLSALDLPGMDGVELVRHIGESRLARAVMIAGTIDAERLSLLEQFRHAYGLQVLGCVPLPLVREQIAALMRQYRRDAEPRPTVTRPMKAFSREEVLHALERGQFGFLYQPNVWLSTGAIAGCEALLRWFRPDRAEPVTPDAFIPVLEREKRLSQLTRVMVGVAATQCAKWRRDGLEIGVSINLSVSDLAEIATIERFGDLVRRCGAQPAWITFDLSEAGVMPRASQFALPIDQLRGQGFEVAIDDFGGSGTSFKELKRLPFTELKIDRQFVNQCESEPRRRKVLVDSIELARRQHLRTCAIGVESIGDWNVLKQAGCQRAQGWLIAKAMRAEDFPNWAANYAPPV